MRDTQKYRITITPISEKRLLQAPPVTVEGGFAEILLDVVFQLSGPRIETTSFFDKTFIL